MPLTKTLLHPLGLYYPLRRHWRQQWTRRKTAELSAIHRAVQQGGMRCNLCNARFERFGRWMPTETNSGALHEHQVVAGYGEQCYCPGCLSTYRDRMVVAYIEKLWRPANLDILHLAPEEPVYRRLAGKNRVVTGDFAPEEYQHIDRAITKQDATSLSFADGQFDAVIANHIMEHIRDDSRAMREFWRVLRPGGRAILQTPFSLTLATSIEDREIDDPARQSELFGQPDHVRIYALPDYLNRLRGAGFDVKVHQAAELNEPEVPFQPNEVLIVAYKPA